MTNENDSSDITDGDDWLHVEMADVLMRRSSPLVRASPNVHTTFLGTAGGMNLDVILYQTSPLIRSGRLDSPLGSPSIRAAVDGRAASATGSTTNGIDTANRSSPIRLSRPRSNPRSRTPMRYESPLQADAFRIREDEDAEGPEQVSASRETPRMEGRRIAIRPMAGRAVGTMAPTTEVSLPYIFGGVLI
jgi:hypothetical protein